MNPPSPSDREPYESIDAGYYYRAMRQGPAVQRFWHRQKFLAAAALIPRSARVLDIGCGPGSFASILAEEAPPGSYVGIDIAEQQLTFALQKATPLPPNASFICFDGCNIPLCDKSTDCVVLIELLEHLQRNNLRDLLNECRRVLRPGGKLVVTTPNYQSHWPLIEWVLDCVSPIKYSLQHITKFTRKSLESVLIESGFQTPRIISIFAVAPFTAAIVGERFAKAILAAEKKLPILPGALLLAEADLL